MKRTRVSPALGKDAEQGTMSDYMYFGKLLGQTAHEVRDLVEESMGLEVDDESSEHLAGLEEMAAVFAESLAESGSGPKCSGSLRRNKQKAGGARAGLRAQAPREKPRAAEQPRALGKLMRNKQLHAPLDGPAPPPGLGTMESLLGSGADGAPAAGRGGEGGASSRDESPRAPELLAKPPGRPGGSAPPPRPGRRPGPPPRERAPGRAPPPSLAGPPRRRRRSDKDSEGDRGPPPSQPPHGSGGAPRRELPGALVGPPRRRGASARRGGSQP